jgi:hypothetical protein
MAGIPPDIPDMVPDRGESPRAVLDLPGAPVGRVRKESAEPPPIRPGMKPSNVPP